MHISVVDIYYSCIHIENYIFSSNNQIVSACNFKIRLSVKIDKEIDQTKNRVVATVGKGVLKIYITAKIWDTKFILSESLYFNTIL